MQGYYFIHSPDDWSDADVVKIRNDLEDMGYTHDRSAAIGEGAGGAGFETVIEFVLTNPLASGLLTTAIWEVAKALYGKRPNAKQLPAELPQRLDQYRMVVHIDYGDQHTIVSVDLMENLENTETAIRINLAERLAKKPHRIDQHGDEWDIF